MWKSSKIILRSINDSKQNFKKYFSAIIVQGLANDLVKGSLLSRLVKEVGLSLINGLALAIIVVIFGQIVNQDLLMSLTIAGSMMGVIIIAALVGTLNTTLKKILLCLGALDLMQCGNF